MLSQFYFKNFEADEVIRTSANIALNKILDRVPYGSTVIALLEEQEGGYKCSLDIYSTQGPFMASMVRPTALDAIQAVEEKFKNQTKRCWSHRGAPTQTVEKKFIQAVS